MKKYKLIKEYPGSHLIAELGMIIVNAPGRNFDAEKYPEFWEEVKKKEYEILSFADVFNIHDVKAHSVKRLSDGEVFTVGDIIEDEDGRDYKNTGIKEIDIDREENLYIITDANGNGIVTDRLCWKLEEIKHKKIYNKKDVEKLCRDAFLSGISTAYIAKDRWIETLNKWLKNNLK